MFGHCNHNCLVSYHTKVKLRLIKNEKGFTMLIEYRGMKPQIARNVFVAPTALLLGDVRVEQGTSIWFGAVLRADTGTILVGAGSNIQDNAVLHVPREGSTILGEDVTIGHGAILEGCCIGNRSVVGMNAVVLHGAEVGEEVMIAAGSVVKEEAFIAPRQLVAGIPAQVKKQLGGSAQNWIRRAAHSYHNLRDEYLKQGSCKLLGSTKEGF